MSGSSNIPAQPEHNVRRRLAAILCADVEGYTRLVNLDEPGTLRLFAAQRDIIDRLIGQHRGRIANTAGDGILAEFASGTDCLQCALDILERVAAVNQEVPEARRVNFRIGLHVGEVSVKNGDLLGDDVNIAARIQQLAEAGTICLSETAHQFMHRSQPLRFEDLGPKLVKNLDEAIRVYMVRPSALRVSQTLPLVHRRAEGHLARRFNQICVDILQRISGRENLRPVEFGVLTSLHDAPGIDHLQISKRMGLAPDRARRILKRLEAQALVEAISVEGPRRQSSLQLTEAGMAVVQRLRPAIAAAQDRIAAPLSEQERETLRELLARIIRVNEAKGETDQG